MVEDERASVRKRPKSAKVAAKRVRFSDEFGVELPPFSEEEPGAAAEPPGGAERSGPPSPRGGRCSPPPPSRGYSPPPEPQGCEGLGGGRTSLCAVCGERAPTPRGGADGAEVGAEFQLVLETLTGHVILATRDEQALAAKMRPGARLLVATDVEVRRQTTSHVR